MASRVNYFRVADLLGSKQAPLDLYRFPHSPLTFRVYAAYRELEISRGLLAARLVAYGSALGNSFMDYKKVSSFVSDLYSSLLSSIPYMNNTSSKRLTNSDRQSFVEQYWKMRQQILEENVKKTDG